MDISNYLINILKKNKILAIILIALAVMSAFIHTKVQNIKYQTHFITTNGLYNPDYLKELITFNEIDSITFNLSNEKLEKCKTALTDISITNQVGSNQYIRLNLVSSINSNNKKFDIQESITELMNNNNYILDLNERTYRPKIKQLDLIIREIENYRSALDSLSLKKKTKTYIKIEKRLYALNLSKIKIEEELDTIGKFRVITPITNFTKIKRPLILYLFLYTFLALVLFVFMSKKKIKQPYSD